MASHTQKQQTDDMASKKKQQQHKFNHSPTSPFHVVKKDKPFHVVSKDNPYATVECYATGSTTTTIHRESTWPPTNTADPTYFNASDHVSRVTEKPKKKKKGGKFPVPKNPSSAKRRVNTTSDNTAKKAKTPFKVHTDNTYNQVPLPKYHEKILENLSQKAENGKLRRDNIKLIKLLDAAKQRHEADKAENDALFKANQALCRRFFPLEEQCALLQRELGVLKAENAQLRKFTK